ncbi:MAG: recombinase family protein [Bacilli bacterium]|nr:recombinase family protein [Bacilli bacterium]
MDHNFKRYWKLLKVHNANVIIIYKLDRLTRSVRDSDVLITELEIHSCRLQVYYG